MSAPERIALVSSSVLALPGATDARGWLAKILTEGAFSRVLVPAVLGESASDAAVIAYDPPLSMVRHAPLWLPQVGAGAGEVHICGSGTLGDDADAFAIAAYLPSRSAFYHAPDGARRDVTSLVRALRVDFRQRQPVGRRLDDADANRVQAEITKHYVAQLAGNGFLTIPQGKPQAGVRVHFSQRVGLAQDLVMRTPEISGNAWWPLGTAPDGAIYITRDHRLAYARLIEKLPDVGSALEVGCGSGFVTLFLAAGDRRKFRTLEAGDLTEERVQGARLLAQLSGLEAGFRAMSADQLLYPDKSFDVVHTCFVLEQCVEILDKALDECLRVARKFIVLFEPSVEFYPNIPGLVHIPMNGFPTDYGRRLMQRGLSFSVLRPSLRYIYNPGAIIVISVDDPRPPHVICPDLLAEIAIVHV